MTNEQKSKRASLWSGLLGSVLLAALVMFIGRTGLLYDLELKTYDARFLVRGPMPVDHSDIVIVAIDDESFSTLPVRWPFPRSYHARLIHNLLAAGARLIVYDVQFTEPSDPVEDSLLALATAEAHGNIIHAGKIAYYSDPRLNKVLTQALLPIQSLRDAGAKIGIVNYASDRDGFTRQYQLFAVHGNTNYVPISMKALQILDAMPDTVQLLREKNVLLFGDRRIPLLTQSTMLINFYGPAATFQTVSFASVLDDQEFDLLKDDTDYMQWFLMSDEEFAVLEQILPPESVEAFRELRAENPFKDKIVFVGASAAELQDNKKTPFYTYAPPGEHSRNQETPGVEVHANALQTLLDGSFIGNVTPLVEFLITFLLAALVFLINNSTRLLVGSLATFGLIVLFGVSAIYLFIVQRLWVAMVVPIISTMTAYVGTTVYRFILEQKEKAMIRGMFSQYVPQKVVSELINNPDMLKLGGEKRRMTALFTDVAGFTSVSEKLTPEELVQLLNEYLSEMSKIVLDHEGIIDKYEGDLIMAEWGAPIYFENHAELACRAALHMQRRLAELREKWKETGTPQLYSRVGINTGDMIVGNMGCLEVFDYTVMGDAVNLASRLEGANKSYNTTIMIGPETHKDVHDKFVTRQLDNLQVKGKLEPVTVFELIAEGPDELPPEKHKVLALYAEGLELYLEMKFAEAKERFEAALEIDPEDGPSKTYRDRCVHFLTNPPPEDWDRVYVLTEK